MSQKKPVMGRGLEALLGQMSNRPAPAPGVPAAEAPPPAKLPGDELANLPLDLLQRGKYQPRVDMRPETLTELADSIKSQGVVQPIVVRPLEPPGNGESQRYEIIAGERRWRAAQRAALHEIPIVPLEASDSEALELAIIENVQRTDLNPLEEGAGYQALASEDGHSHEDIAKIVGKSRSHVTNTLRLLKLPEPVKAYIHAGKITAGAARMLIGAADPEEMAREIVEDTEIRAILSQIASLQSACDMLVEAALDGGGEDNATCMLLRVRNSNGTALPQ